MASRFNAELSQESHDVTLIDVDRQRLDRAGERLDVRTLYDHGASPQVLEKAGAQRANLVAAVTNSDEVNLMSSLQAKELGVRQTIVAVNRVDYAPIVERVGINHAVSPRILTGNRILTLAGREGISSMAVLQEGKAEVVEMTAQPGAPAVGKSLGDEVRTPKGSIIGALVRDTEVIVPRGGDRIYPGDTVIAFSLSSVVGELGAMFSNGKRQ